MIFLTTAFAVLFPLFGKIAIGYGLKQVKLISDRACREMNNIIFRIFIPALLFSNIYNTNFDEITSYRLLGFTLIAMLVMFVFYMILIPLLVKENSKRGVLVQGICRSNFIFFGIPMATTIYGGTSAGLASLMIGVVVPLVNVTSVFALEYFRGKTPDYAKILKGIVLNPIIIGGLLGFLFSLLGIRIPAPIGDLIDDVAGIATPLALIVLGASVSFSSIKTNLRPLLIGVFNRLVIVPAIGLPIAILLGFRGVELVLLMSLFASPAAITSYTVAQQMDGDAELAGQFVVFSTAFSLITLFFWIAGLMALGYF